MLPGWTEYHRNTILRISMVIDIIAVGTDDADSSFLKKLASRNDLGIKVLRPKFEKGIIQAARSLPQLRAGGPELIEKGN